jgi:hypothetical protein
MRILEYLPELGLLAIGMLYFHNLNPYYILLGLILVNLADYTGTDRRFDGELRVLMKGFALFIVIFAWEMNISKTILMLAIGGAIIFYTEAKKYPISAVYQGFGYALLFWIPATYFSMAALGLYLVLGALGTLSEIAHEAQHYDKDRQHGRFTTAHLLNLKIDETGRYAFRAFIMLVGLIIGGGVAYGIVV